MLCFERSLAELKRKSEAGYLSIYSALTDKPRGVRSVEDLGSSVGNTKRDWWRRSCSSSLFRSAWLPLIGRIEPCRKESVKQAIGSRNSRPANAGRNLGITSQLSVNLLWTWKAAAQTELYRLSSSMPRRHRQSPLEC